MSDWIELNWTPRDLPNPEIEPTSPVSPALAGWFFTTEPLGKPHAHMRTGKTTALTIWSFVGKWYFCFLICYLVCHSVPSKEQVSFNFMAAVTICSDFGARENKVCHYFHFFPFYLPWSDGTGCHDLSFWFFFFFPNIEFQTSLFTILFQPHQEDLYRVIQITMTVSPIRASQTISTWISC